MARIAIVLDRDATYRDFGRRVASARKRAGLTQELLARKLSLSRATIANIERGRQAVLLHIAYGIADALGVALTELLPDIAALRSSEELLNMIERGSFQLPTEVRRALYDSSKPRR